MIKRGTNFSFLYSGDQYVFFQQHIQMKCQEVKEAQKKLLVGEREKILWSRMDFRKGERIFSVQNCEQIPLTARLDTNKSYREWWAKTIW